MAAQPEQQPQQQQQQPPAGAPQEPAEGKAVWQGTSAEHAQQMVDKATQRNPMVKFMLDKMAEVRRRRAPPAAPACGPQLWCAGLLKALEHVLMGITAAIAWPLKQPPL